MRYKGNILYFKGTYGFIKPTAEDMKKNNLQRDYFFHMTNYEKEDAPPIGQDVSFEIKASEKKGRKPEATKIKEENFLLEDMIKMFRQMPKQIEQKRYGIGNCWLTVSKTYCEETKGKELEIIYGNVIREEDEEMMIEGYATRTKNATFIRAVDEGKNIKLLSMDLLRSKDLKFSFTVKKRDIIKEQKMPEYKRP